MKNKKYTINLTIPFMAWLMVFVTLKIINVVSWSWGIVLLPLWIGLAFYIPALIISLIIRNITKKVFEQINYTVKIKENNTTK